MVEQTPVLDALAQLILMVGVVLDLPADLLCLRDRVADAAAGADGADAVASGRPIPDNIATAWQKADFGRLFFNSLVVSVGIVVGKIAVSLLAAFAVTYFRFPFRMTAFWLIFVSLMLPIEVRIVPTYESAANAALPFNTLVEWLGLRAALAAVAGHQVSLTVEWSLVNTYAGMILPLIASATATFLFRQFFLTVPDEMCEAARVDGARRCNSSG